MASADPFVIAGRELNSRLILGTGGFTSHELLARACEESEAELCTVALRRLESPLVAEFLKDPDQSVVQGGHFGAPAGRVRPRAVYQDNRRLGLPRRQARVPPLYQ